MYEDPNNNKSYLLGHKTYEGDDKELQDENLKNIQENLIDLSFTKQRRRR